MVLSGDIKPKGETADLDGCKEGGAVFGVPCCDASPSFKMQESIFNKVSDLVQVCVIETLFFSILFGGITA